MNAILSPEGFPVQHLGIGEGGVFETPARVHVLLGSCVAVTFHSPSRGIGATFHALLPSRAEFARQGQDDGPFRYVDSAISELLSRLRGLRCMADLEVKVFGGANSLVQGEFGIGMKNVRTAFASLALSGLRVSASNVGGTRGRKLVFLPSSGEVYMKVLSETPVSGMTASLNRCPLGKP
ncbi:chemotaxis protein CheD [Desulfovibrio aminophilus]|nr:chemotaxis protein CheD [Desulfovibrio aminophilus]MCM0755490.1 chemotaxis protein CheD [Desulfovibrio aminophilus]